MSCLLFRGLPSLVFVVSILASGPAGSQANEETWAGCLACHGERGTSETPDVPSLGGQPELYILGQLVQFRENLRNAPPMNDLIKGLKDDDLRHLASAVARLPAPKPVPVEDAAQVKRGGALAAQNRCNVCHSANYAGNDQLPRLAGQRMDYLIRALTAFRASERADADGRMIEAVKPLSDADIADVAAFLSSLP